jgi:hypothetical protein
MSNNTTAHISIDNDEFQNAWNMIQHTHRSVFLTGKAGTGKSTFLKYICAHTQKQHVVLAPTGIAAVNVGGQTLHSFFKIPFKPLIPGDIDYSPRNMRKSLRYPKEKVKLIQNLELIIIDEISMVRCDIIDFIDQVLRVYSGNMREPFGGKQLLFVGDIFQLEPVVTRDMREILRRWYSQFYFFNAKVFGSLGLVPIELKKIYRQTDSNFISLLDRVRVSHATTLDMATLNSRYNPLHQDEGEFVITLATRRDTVDAINDEHMHALKTPEFTFKGTIDGNFPENDLPTSKELTLKEGAQVIFIRNDKENRWVNGTIAKVSFVNEDKMEVALEDGEVYELEQEQWENVQYAYDEKEKKIIENVLGTFKQYPIKPAWALTVHKSQGLTFNKVVIDFAGGAFTGGQTYVALSRCTSLEGITLLKPLQERDIIVSSSVVEFSRQFNNQAIIDNALEQEKASQLYRRAIHAFDHNEFRDCVESFVQAKNIKDVTNSEAVQRLVAVKLQRFNTMARQVEKLQEVIDNQNKLLRELALEYVAMGDQSMGLGELVGEESANYGRAHQQRLDEIAIKSGMANYNKALRIHPTCINAMLGKARLLVAIDQLDEAELTLKQALKIDSKNYEVHIALAELYANLKDVPAAIKSYKRAIKANKKQALPHEALATIYEKLGLDDLAEEHANHAKKIRKATAPKKRSKKQ